MYIDIIYVDVGHDLYNCVVLFFSWDAKKTAMRISRWSVYTIAPKVFQYLHQERSYFVT